MSLLKAWKQRAKQCKQQIHTLGLACRDPRTPWYVRWLAWGVLAYALSPIDLIPDFIPILGQLDDLVLVPLGLYLVWRMIPEQVRADCRQRANSRIEGRNRPMGYDLHYVVKAVMWRPTERLR